MRSYVRLALSVLVIGVSMVPAVIDAQLVVPRSVPVHQNDQFDLLPSSRAGMAGVWIALDDTLLDPFANPAKVVRVRESAFFALPYAHSISGNRGGGRTVPLGGFFAGGAWSGAASVALQQLNRGRAGFGAPLSERSATNQYVSGVVARRLTPGVTLGASTFIASLGAIDGVDLLYAGSDTIRQNGSMADVRVGLTKEWGDRRVLEFIVVHNRTAMSHDVHTTTFALDSARRIWMPVGAWDHNADRTNIWGVHTEYVRPFGSEGWRVGWLATANRISHPKIPNYRLMNIPRDPGFTHAFNAGVGFGRAVGPTTFGVDFVYEPIFSNTWADAARDTARTGGGTIGAGQRTVENWFRFANTKFRLGMGREFRHRSDTTRVSGFQFGLAWGNTSYRLRQRNNVRSTTREQNEAWVEWAPTFGYRYRTRDLEFYYNARLTCISGSQCGPEFAGDDVSISPPTAGGGVIAAPAEPLTFDAGRAFVHRFMVRIPLR